MTLRCTIACSGPSQRRSGRGGKAISNGQVDIYCIIFMYQYVSITVSFAMTTSEAIKWKVAAVCLGEGNNPNRRWWLGSGSRLGWREGARFGITNFIKTYIGHTHSKSTTHTDEEKRHSTTKYSTIIASGHAEMHMAQEVKCTLQNEGDCHSKVKRTWFVLSLDSYYYNNRFPPCGSRKVV
jgi:hypothetical protein